MILSTIANLHLCPVLWKLLEFSRYGNPFSCQQKREFPVSHLKCACHRLSHVGFSQLRRLMCVIRKSTNLPAAIIKENKLWGDCSISLDWLINWTLHCSEFLGIGREFPFPGIKKEGCVCAGGRRGGGTKNFLGRAIHKKKKIVCLLYPFSCFLLFSPLSCWMRNSWFSDEKKGVFLYMYIGQTEKNSFYFKFCENILFSFFYQFKHQ